MKKSITYGAGLIALYLIVKWGSNFSTAASGVGTAGAKIITSLQGR